MNSRFSAAKPSRSLCVIIAFWRGVSTLRENPNKIRRFRSRFLVRFGLHDLKYMGTDGKNLADPKQSTSHQQVPLAQYVNNMRTIATRLKQTGAKVIWCQTTPVPEGSAGRVVGDAVKYNEAAADVMSELGGIATDDLYDFSLANVTSEQRPANVHYTPEGSKLLAGHVVECIREALKTK